MDDSTDPGKVTIAARKGEKGEYNFAHLYYPNKKY